MVICTIANIVASDDAINISDFYVQGISPAQANGTVSEHVPYMASIRLKSEELNKNFGYGHFCGGVFVTRQHVLTLATCLSRTRLIDPFELEIVAGTRYRYDDSQAYVYYVTKYVLHPDFTNKNIPDNVAIIFVSFKCFDVVFTINENQIFSWKKKCRQRLTQFIQSKYPTTALC